MGTVIRLEDVSKRFIIKKDKSLKERAIHAWRHEKGTEDFWALQDISLDIEAGTTVGLVGHNGSGKSTLLKLVGGIMQPTTGNVYHSGRIAALLELGAGFHPDLSGRENVYLNASILGMSRKQTDRYFDAIVDFSGIEQFIDSQVKFYSSGMYIRLAFAVAVHVDPEILLVDEVLAVGDEPFQRKCMDRIHTFQTEGRTIVLVSHSSGQVGELCDRVVVMDRGHAIFDGEPEQGLRVLRTGYEEARLEEVSEKHAEEAIPPARILDVHLLDTDGVESRQFVAGAPARVVIDVESDSPIEDWRVGLSIETPISQVAYGVNTVLTGTELPVLERRRSVAFDIPALHLTGGQYYITAAVETREGVAIDWRQQAMMFEVVSTDPGIGIAGLHPAVHLASSAGGLQVTGGPNSLG